MELRLWKSNIPKWSKRPIGRKNVRRQYLDNQATQSHCYYRT